METAPRCSRAFCPVDLAQDRFRQSIASADDLETRATLPEPFILKTEEGAQEPENTLHFSCGPAPVVGGEGVDGKATDTYIRCSLHDTPQSGHSGTMPGDARQPAPHRPAAVP